LSFTTNSKLREYFVVDVLNLHFLGLWCRNSVAIIVIEVIINVIDRYANGSFVCMKILIVSRETWIRITIATPAMNKSISRPRFFRNSVTLCLKSVLLIDIYVPSVSNALGKILEVSIFVTLLVVVIKL